MTNTDVASEHPQKVISLYESKTLKLREIQYVIHIYFYCSTINISKEKADQFMGLSES